MSEKEYIERGAVLDQMMFEMVGTGVQGKAMDVIRYAPAADVVEVVRCNDCRHYGFAKIAGESYMTCKNHFGLTDPSSTDFCINGERKEQT